MRIWPDVVLPAARGALLPGRLTRGRDAGRAASASGGRTSGSTSPAVLAPLRRGRGDPTWRPATGRRRGPRAGRVGRLADRHDPGRAGHHAAAPPGRRHRGRAGLGTGRGVGAGRGCPALLGARDRPEEFVAHHPLVADAHRRMPGPAVRAPPAGVGRAAARGAGAEGDRRGGAPVLAGAVLAVRRAGTRPGAGRDAGAADPGGDPRPCPTGSGTGPGWTTPGGGPSSRAAAVAHRLEAACELGGEPRAAAAAPGARDRDLDRGRGGPAGLGRPGRGELR